MATSPSRLQPDYGYEFVTAGGRRGGTYPVTVTLAHSGGLDAGEELTVRAQYVVGCDGARSKVRAAIGCEMPGDTANHAWGVMDVLATTDFPDSRQERDQVRRKAAASC